MDDEISAMSKHSHAYSRGSRKFWVSRVKNTKVLTDKHNKPVRDRVTRSSLEMTVGLNSKDMNRIKKQGVMKDTEHISFNI